MADENNIVERIIKRIKFPGMDVAYEIRDAEAVHKGELVSILSDTSLEVDEDGKLDVKVSDKADNILQKIVSGDKGLYVPKNKTLTFGSNQAYTYDGTEDVNVPVYQGQINN